MKLISQDIFAGDAQGRIGNCLPAAIATLLGLQLNEVPHFCGLDSDNWYRDMMKWLKDNGYSFYDVNSVLYMQGFSIAVGMSVRGVYHAVVYKDGELFHDPHPSRDGIIKAENYYIIFKDETT